MATEKADTQPRREIEIWGDIQHPGILGFHDY